MLVTSSAVALADYECASQSSDCNATTNWTTQTKTGCTQTITDVAFKIDEVTTPTEFNTKTSVWWIDNLEIEY